ncbi:hypothetical protein H5410_044674 [Solanum commersonii]|uniref:Uncharacterized protein n=1 Tax=Solanum commersonii TaxID=4109 RepID=A0A9J5XBK5_SOLCO|nr:hypothetical protein H5410_044674 [Solanum commersonii]
MMRSKNRLDWRATDEGKIHISCKSPKFSTQALSYASIFAKKTHIGVSSNANVLGRPPFPHELLKKTHTKGNDEFVDLKSKRTYVTTAPPLYVLRRDRHHLLVATTHLSPFSPTSLHPPPHSPLADEASSKAAVRPAAPRGEHHRRGLKQQLLRLASSSNSCSGQQRPPTTAAASSLAGTTSNTGRDSSSRSSRLQPAVATRRTSSSSQQHWQQQLRPATACSRRRQLAAAPDPASNTNSSSKQQRRLLRRDGTPWTAFARTKS